MGIKLLVALTVVTSGIALFGWFLFIKPDLGASRDFFSKTPIWILILVGASFAATNALLEEVIFRGLFFDAFLAAVGNPKGALILQALLFGASHFGSTSIPHGPLGVGMTFAYGLMLGSLRHTAGGLLAPWVAHTLADAVVFLLIGIANS